MFERKGPMSETVGKIAVFCVGNRLHLDDGVGPAVYDVVKERFDVPENVEHVSVCLVEKFRLALSLLLMEL